MKDAPQIPVQYAEGPEETTIWVFADSPDSITVTLPRDEWEEFLGNVEEHYDGDIERFFGDHITGFVNGEIEL